MNVSGLMLPSGPWKAVSQVADPEDQPGSGNYGGRKRRTMSAAARKRISEMMKLALGRKKEESQGERLRSQACPAVPT